VVSNCDLCINGTTVGLNALITHKRRQDRPDLHRRPRGFDRDPQLGHKEDGYPLRSGVSARDHAGAALPAQGRARARAVRRQRSHADEEEDVRAACELFLKEGIETVAISFVWSVLQPRARAPRRRDRARDDAGRDPDRRLGTLPAGPRIHPHLDGGGQRLPGADHARYVAAVDAYFRSLGAKQPVRYFQSNGGLAIGQAMTDRSVYAINSGPASAPQAGLYVSASRSRRRT
jgi:N-methylhydantoinase A